MYEAADTMEKCIKILHALLRLSSYNLQDINLPLRYVYAVGIIINVFHNREMLKISLKNNAYQPRKNHLHYSHTARKTFELSSSFSHALVHCY